MDTFYKSIRRITSLSEINRQTLNLVYCEPGCWIGYRISKVCLEAPIMELLQLFKHLYKQDEGDLIDIICNHTSHLSNGFRLKHHLFGGGHTDQYNADLYRGNQFILSLSTEKRKFMINCERIFQSNPQFNVNFQITNSFDQEVSHEELMHTAQKNCLE